MKIKKNQVKNKASAIYRDYSARIDALAKKQTETIEAFLLELEKRKIAELKQQF